MDVSKLLEEEITENSEKEEYLQVLMLTLDTVLLSGKGQDHLDEMKRMSKDSRLSGYKMPEISDLISEYYVSDSEKFTRSEFEDAFTGISLGLSDESYFSRGEYVPPAKILCAVSKSTDPNEFVYLYNQIYDLQKKEEFKMAGVYWLNVIYKLSQVRHYGDKLAFCKQKLFSLKQSGSFLESRKLQLEIEKELIKPQNF